MLHQWFNLVRIVTAFSLLALPASSQANICNAIYFGIKARNTNELGNRAVEWDKQIPKLSNDDLASLSQRLFVLDKQLTVTLAQNGLKINSAAKKYQAALKYMESSSLILRWLLHAGNQVGKPRGEYVSLRLDAMDMESRRNEIFQIQKKIEETIIARAKSGP